MIIYVGQEWKEHLSECSLSKHSCSWLDKLMIVKTLKESRITFSQAAKVWINKYVRRYIYEFMQIDVCGSTYKTSILSKFVESLFWVNVIAT